MHTLHTERESSRVASCTSQGRYLSRFLYSKNTRVCPELFAKARSLIRAHDWARVARRRGGWGGIGQTAFFFFIFLRFSFMFCLSSVFFIFFYWFYWVYKFDFLQTLNTYIQTFDTQIQIFYTHIQIFGHIFSVFSLVFPCFFRFFKYVRTQYTIYKHSIHKYKLLLLAGVGSDAIWGISGPKE